MMLVIQGDKIAGRVGDDYTGSEQVIAEPAGFDIALAHKHRFDAASGQVVRRVPDEVPMSAARLVLFAHGLLSQVQPAINALPEPSKTRAQIQFDVGKVLERNNPFTLLLAPALGLDAAEMDALFIEAGDL